MESEKKKIVLPKLIDVNNKINELIDERISKSVMNVLESISDGENYDLEYLIDKYGGKYIKPIVQFSISPTTLKAVEGNTFKGFHPL